MVQKYAKLMFAIIFINNCLYAISKAPEIKAPVVRKNTIQFEFYDKSNRRIIYDTIPVLLGSDDRGILSIQPAVSRDTVTGETGLQFWMSHYPIFGPLGHPQILDAEYITISTIRRSVKLPLMFKQFVPPTEKIPPPGIVSDAQETAYIYLFPEDISKLQLLIADTDKIPIDTWEPRSVEERLAQLKKNQVSYNPSIYKIDELDNFHTAQNRMYTENGYSKRLNVKMIQYKSTPYYDPPLLQQRSATLTLHGSKGKKIWEVPPNQLWVLLESIELYQKVASNDSSISISY